MDKENILQRTWICFLESEMLTQFVSEVLHSGLLIWSRTSCRLRGVFLWKEVFTFSWGLVYILYTAIWNWGHHLSMYTLISFVCVMNDIQTLPILVLQLILDLVISIWDFSHKHIHVHVYTGIWPRGNRAKTVGKNRAQQQEKEKKLIKQEKKNFLFVIRSLYLYFYVWKILGKSPPPHNQTHPTHHTHHP